MNFRYVMALIVLMLASASCACIGSDDTSDELFQNAPIQALMEGGYQGTLTCAELVEKGDLGLGTFDGLDGEMVVLDGTVYQVKIDGSVLEVGGDETTPWAAVTFFDSDLAASPEAGMSLVELESYIESMLPSKNICYAIRIDGTFEYVKARSVPEQYPPYPRLVDVIPHQAIFEMENVEGTMVGFWMPSYVGGINVSGFHIHFISDDRQRGGHVLDATAGDIAIGIDCMYDFTIKLPEQEEYLDLDLEAETDAGEIDTVEKGS